MHLHLLALNRPSLSFLTHPFLTRSSPINEIYRFVVRRVVNHELTILSAFLVSPLIKEASHESQFIVIFSSVIRPSTSLLCNAYRRINFLIPHYVYYYVLSTFYLKNYANTDPQFRIRLKSFFSYYSTVSSVYN